MLATLDGGKCTKNDAWKEDLHESVEFFSQNNHENVHVEKPCWTSRGHNNSSPSQGSEYISRQVHPCVGCSPELASRSGKSLRLRSEEGERKKANQLGGKREEEGGGKELLVSAARWS